MRALRLIKYFLLVNILFAPQYIFAKQKPNVIIIITDDQGYGDLAAHGNDIIKTPNMDKLHDVGVRFTNFHCGTTCAPSRSGLMAGVDGNRAGVWHTIGGCNILREKFTIMPQVFKASGYATAMYGKWHLGDAYPYLPEHRGFDETVAHGGGGIGQTPDYWGNDYFDDTYFRNGKPEKFEGYCTDVFFREAIDFIERKKDQPFFVYLSPNAPHGPFNVEKEYYDLYKNEITLSDRQKTFFGMITNIDDNMGLLTKKLKELGIEDNTILIFTTDNGTASGIEKRNGEWIGYNAGMRGKKGSEYDGGHRVPLFIYWKDGEVTGGYDIPQIVMNYDILPTLIDLCNLDNDDSEYDGLSLVPLIKKQTEKWSHRYCVVDNNRSQHPKKWRKSAVMDDEWRLINGKELYHIAKDIGQTDNIAEAHPERVKAMRVAYEQWWDHVSPDFSYYEAYKIGVPGIEEHVITIHDLHTYTQIPWFQSHIRNPLKGKKQTLPLGYWMIDVKEKGEYEFTLSRWPRASGLGFSDVTPKLGVKSGWYDTMPAGIAVDLKKAAVKIQGLYEEAKAQD